MLPSTLSILPLIGSWCFGCADETVKAVLDSIKLVLQAFDSSALGGGVGGGGIMGRDADQSNMKTDGPPSGPSSDPAVS